MTGREVWFGQPAISSLIPFEDPSTFLPDVRPSFREPLRIPRPFFYYSFFFSLSVFSFFFLIKEKRHPPTKLYYGASHRSIDLFLHRATRQLGLATLAKKYYLLLSTPPSPHPTYTTTTCFLPLNRKAPEPVLKPARRYYYHYLSPLLRLATNYRLVNCSIHLWGDSRHLCLSTYTYHSFFFFFLPPPLCSRSFSFALTYLLFIILHCLFSFSFTFLFCYFPFFSLCHIPRARFSNSCYFWYRYDLIPGCHPR